MVLYAVPEAMDLSRCAVGQMQSKFGKKSDFRGNAQDVIRCGFTITLQAKNL